MSESMPEIRHPLPARVHMPRNSFGVTIGRLWLGNVMADLETGTVLPSNVS
jgi:hypothetical protein